MLDIQVLRNEIDACNYDEKVVLKRHAVML